MKGRYIGENIRKVLEIIEYSEIEDKPGVLISIDFEKAFDSLEWDFIFKTLKYFDLGDHFIDLVKLLYTDTKSCCMNNGWASEFFSLGRGVQQGCPFSPYLFILCSEILGNAIRADKTIGGIKINVGSSEHETKLSQYADDTNVFLDGEVNSLRALLTLFHNFEKLSGLKLNETKTKISCIGNLYRKQEDFKAIFPHMDWISEKMYILGVIIPLKTDSRKLMDWNLLSKLK